MYLLRWLSSRLLMWIVLKIASVPSVVKQALACAYFSFVLALLWLSHSLCQTRFIIMGWNIYQSNFTEKYVVD